MTMEIQRLGYQPQALYRLDLEVFSVADLRLRAKEELRLTHRYEFHTVVCVTRGICTQMVDFKSIACAPGSLLVVQQTMMSVALAAADTAAQLVHAVVVALLVVRAGQAHNYGADADWDGWNLLFRPEFALPVSTTSHDLKLALDLERLPEHMVLSDQELGKVTDLLQQMREDTLLDVPQEHVHTLLRHQLHTLLTRLSILQGRRQTQATLVSPASQRFQRFQQLVDKRFAQWHQVADYANQLGYTEKSLARAVAAAAGTTAKAFIAARINLEAKRLLVHLDLPVVTIADRLGFDEPTNFSKFFKREVGCTPAEFRKRQRALVALPT